MHRCRGAHVHRCTAGAQQVHSRCTAGAQVHRCTAEAKVQQRYRGAVEVRQERYNVQLRCRSRGGAEVHMQIQNLLRC